MKRFKIFSILTVTAIFVFSAIYLVVRFEPFMQTTGKNGNVLLIVSDALRKDVLGCYGGEAQTPNIDWLAENGVTFTQAYATAPCTIPSSITMFTGNYAKCYVMVLDKLEHEWTKYIYRVPSAHVLFVEFFREQGIDTRMSVENELAVRTNNAQGFVPLPEKNDLDKASVETIEKAIGIDRDAYPRYESDFGLFHYLLNVSGNTRFFLVKWFMDPHPPYNPPERLKKTMNVDHERLSRDLSFYSRVVNLNEIEWSEYETNVLRKLYMYEVESVDERLGAILELMRMQNLLENTTIILTSDHGESLGEPGKGWKHQHRFWQDIVNVPLIFYGPEIEKGLVIETKVSHVDLMPTIDDLLKTHYEHESFGESYAPLLYGEPMAPRDIFMDTSSQALFPENFDDCALISGEYKYWRHYQGNKLFDMVADPQELDNLIHSHQEMARRLNDKITSLQNEIAIIRDRNIWDVYERFDVEEQSKETLEKLKSLGYIK